VPHAPDTRRQHRRARLVEIARLAGLARVVPSFAHQLATPLASIALRAESLENANDERAGHGASADRLQRYLGAIRQETQKCKELLSTLQQFARPPGLVNDPVDVNELCRGAALLVRHEAMRRQVEVHMELAAPLPVVWGRRGALGQGILALLLNAVDASPQAGRVDVETRLDGQIVELSVADKGERRAEAAFTLGLGLRAAREIAAEHGGSMAVDEAGRRGRIVFRIPLRGAVPDAVGHSDDASA
jgi:signal transduction histidine kinase